MLGSTLAGCWLGLGVGLFELVDLVFEGFDLGIGDIVSILSFYVVLALALSGVVAASIFVVGVAISEARGHDARATFDRIVWGMPFAAPCVAIVILEVVGRSLPPVSTSWVARAVVAGIVVVSGVLYVLWLTRPEIAARWTMATTLLQRTLLVASVALVIYVLWPERERSGLRTALSAAKADLPNIVLVVVDTLRADHLGSYGYDRPTSPFLDSLAAEGVLFESAYSTSNWTRPAVASLLTSTMPSEHGVVKVNRQVPSDMPILTETLAAQGYVVGIFSANVNLHPEDGYARGVDRFEVPSRSMLERTTIANAIVDSVVRNWAGVQELVGEDGETLPSWLVQQATDWVATVVGRAPVFLYLHFLGPHDPYLAPPEFQISLTEDEPRYRYAIPPKAWAGRDAVGGNARARMIAQYDGEILWHDRAVQMLMSNLETLGVIEDVWVVITSDHGEAFGEHGVWAHGHGLFSELTRIPLIFWSSEPLVARTIAEPVSLLDIAPTLLDLAGIDRLESFRGESLEPAIRVGATSERPVFFENPVQGEVGVRTSEWFFFRSASGAGRAAASWLYAGSDLEQNNPLNRMSVSDDLNRLLDINSKEVGARARAEELQVSPERIEALRALGYVQ